MANDAIDYGDMNGNAEVFLKDDFDHSQMTGQEQTDAKAAVDFFTTFADEDLLKEIEAEAYSNMRLGNSRTVMKAVAQGARNAQQRIAQATGQAPGNLKFNMPASASQRGELKREVTSILRKALMEGKNEWIRRSRLSLPG
jgi:hypothetical protein